MRERGWSAGPRAQGAGASFVHHAGRRAFSALGSRAVALPSRVERAISLEGRSSEPPSLASASGITPHQEILRLAREGPAPLLAPQSGVAERTRLHIAMVVPPFGRASGGHAAIFTLMAELERLGHTTSAWVHDPVGLTARTPGSVLRRRAVDEFAPLRAPVLKGFDSWHGADVAVATGWETAYPVMLLPGCHARAYLVHDHEPDFFPTSAEALWAARTYDMGLFPIAGSRWLRDLLERRYGVSGSWYRFGVDHSVYAPAATARRSDTVLFYARASTPRRGVPLGLLALEELQRRRPGLRVLTFGQEERLGTGVKHEHLGLLSPRELASVYSESTVGLCLSLTNYSLIPQEMMACGLPCVDLAGGSTEFELGTDGPVSFAEADPLALADAVDHLLHDRDLWKARSLAGIELTAGLSWAAAAEQLEAGLRSALGSRADAPAE